MVRRIRDNLFYAGIVAAPVLVGGVHVEVAAGLLGLFLAVWAIDELGGGLRSGGSRTGGSSGGRTRVHSIPSLAFWLFAAVCFVQVLPVPGPLQSLWNATGSEMFVSGWEALFGAAPEGRGWRFSSLAPGETFDRGVRWTALAVAAGLGTRWASKSGGWRKLCRVVLVAGGVVTAVGAAQSWFGVDRVLFLYEPTVGLPGFTTFVSDNHAASFAGLVSLAGFFLAFWGRGERPSDRLVGSVAGIGFMLLMFEYGSAGATLAFVVAVGVFLVLFGTTKSAGELLPFEGMRRVIRGVGAAVLALPVLVALAFRYAPASWRDALWQTHVGVWLREKAAIRFEMVRASLEATGDFWVLGAGGGATDRVLAPYIDWSVIHPATIPTIENEPVEWFFQYGVSVGLVAVVLMVGYFWFVYRRYRRRPRFRYVAALSLAAYLGILAQFHFPFFTLGIAIPGVVLLEGLAFPTRSEERSVEGDSVAVESERGVVAFRGRARWAVFAVAAGAGVWFVAGHALYAVELADFDESWAEERTERDYERLVDLIPSDGELYGHAAFSSLDAEELEAAARRAEFAMEREPKPNVGVLVARILSQAGRRAESKEMYRRVFSGDFARIPNKWVRNYLVPDFHEPEELADILERAEPEHWSVAAKLLESTEGPQAAAQFGLALHDRRPEAFVPNRFVVESYMKLGHYSLAETWIRTLMSEFAQTSEYRADRAGLLIQILRAEGRVDDARREAYRALTHENLGGLELGRVAIGLRPSNPEGASKVEAQAIQNARKSVCGGGGKELRRACWQAEAWLEEYRGKYGEAGKVYEGISETTEDPSVYAEFLVRQGKCDRLEEFVDGWEFDTDQGQKHRKVLAELVVECEGK